ncbi:MAG: polysaccharide pyruvyl transferase CsaB [Clostridia bacterium]|nr:polysaccharide pyruvyl transferase CsaB [Clostridia bacterium]
MKNILLTTMKLDIGGAETHIVELAKELKSRGYNPVVASDGGVYVGELERCGIKHYQVPLHNKQPQNLIISAFRLFRIIKKEKIDVVHSHARIPSFVLKCLYRVMDFPFVTTAHWVFETGHGLRYITEWGEFVIAVSDDIKDYLTESYGVPESSVIVTVNGIDTEKFSPDTDPSDVKRELGISDGETVIASVCRLDRTNVTAVKALVSAAPRLDEALHGGLKIIVVGDGDDFQSIKALSNEANAKAGRECVVMTGARTDIHKIVASANLFVGVSRAALEAMSLGKPAILAGAEGFGGLFDADCLDWALKTNFCCRGGEQVTEDAIFAEITRFFALDEAKKAELGHLGREVVLTHYSIKKMADDTIRAYEKAFSRSGILVSGYYGFGNCGDDAMLYCIIDDLRNSIGDPPITVLSASPRKTTRKYGVRSLGRYKYGKIKREMKHSRLLISGGGSLIQDVTSSRSLYYYLHIMKLAKKRGLSVMMYANGIGPMTHKLGKYTAARVISGVDAVTLREPSSMEMLERLCPAHPYARVTFDPALGADGADRARGLEILAHAGVPAGAGVIGVSLRRTPQTNGEFIKRAAELFDRIYKSLGIFTVFIPMQKKRDVKISEAVARKMKSPSAVLPDEISDSDARDVTSCCTLSLGMRLHHLVFSMISGVPSIGLAYDPKIDSFMSYAGLGEAFSVTDFDVDGVFDETVRILSDRDARVSAAIEDRERMSAMRNENGKIAAELYKNGRAETD